FSLEGSALFSKLALSTFGEVLLKILDNGPRGFQLLVKPIILLFQCQDIFAQVPIVRTKNRKNLLTTFNELMSINPLIGVTLPIFLRTPAHITSLLYNLIINVSIFLTCHHLSPAQLPQRCLDH